MRELKIDELKNVTAGSASESKFSEKIQLIISGLNDQQNFIDRERKMTANPSIPAVSV